MKLAVQLLTWNGEEYIPALFDSLSRQTYTDWELLIWDNGSADHTLSIIEQHKNDLKVPIRIFTSPKNIGFASAHDRLFLESSSEYILTLNQDIILDDRLIEDLVEFMKKDRRLASAAPRLMRLEFGEKTSVVDSLGLVVETNRRVRDAGSGSVWNEEDYCCKKDPQVFGVSAALAIYSREAVEKAGGLFDEVYFSYQEDFDLAWRLQHFGFSSAVDLDTVAWHNRSGREPVQKSIWAAFVNKLFHQSAFIRYHSYKNHLMTIIKNEQWQNFVIDFPWIFWYELRKMIYFLIFSQGVLKGFTEVWHNRRHLMDERRRIMNNSKIRWRDMGKWLA